MFHKKSPPLREHKTAKTFTPNAMSICNLQPAGEEVKAKNEKTADVYARVKGTKGKSSLRSIRSPTSGTFTRTMPKKQRDF